MAIIATVWLPEKAYCDFIGDVLLYGWLVCDRCATGVRHGVRTRCRTQRIIGKRLIWSTFVHPFRPQNEHNLYNKFIRFLEVE